ncbi:MAG: hypothetical protein KF693_09645 [Nitrospira sp.]|nr:hypothetical protein [Nitrospira sp.]
MPACPDRRGVSPISIAAWALVLLCGGCGPSVPDGAKDVSSPPTTSAGSIDGTHIPVSSPIGGVTAPASTLEEGEGRAVETEQAKDHRSPLDSLIPQTITNDLSSPDARVRYRALDHWEDKDSKAPLDPVFEAMEDEDEAVREKATTIVEQRWAEEQEKEEG